MKSRWFTSRQYRRASDLFEDAARRRNEQLDLLPERDLEPLDQALRELQSALDTGAGEDVLSQRCGELSEAAHCLMPSPQSAIRENVETLLVVIVVAMSIRTFFFQPFRIPTGSMQPTLFGITVKDLRNDPDFVMPGFLQRAWEFVTGGVIYHQVIAAADGEFDHAEPVGSFLGMVNRQTFWVRYGNGHPVPITIWCGPEAVYFEGAAHLAGLRSDFPRHFQKGEPILQIVETTGDHLLVDRFTYNFRKPERGEIVVFKTGHIPHPGNDQFYIKRLIGLPGERVSIGEDRHARINATRLDSATPHFKEIYGFDPSTPAEESRYSGHVLDGNSQILNSSDKVLQVRAGHYAVFGDNTVNSSDSRYWGDFPQEDVMGRAWLIYWPFSRRSGFAISR